MQPDLSFPGLASASVQLDSVLTARLIGRSCMAGLMHCYGNAILCSQPDLLSLSA